MNERWWAPQRATVEPDAVVLAMLEPGDFGAAILAAHRAGAAAIETVSKGALPSEERLTQAMVTARANLSDAVVDVVAKSVETPTYAALLMRDVFDEAETAAVGLYRAAVAKGVSPPVAAQRAGLVYGVPATELGRYHALATDPKSSPVAVTDAADRVLMTYVSKLAAQEVVGQQTEIAKTGVAPDEPRHHHTEPTVSAGWREWLHPRDAEGQFVQRHTTGNKPVATLDAEPKPVEPRVGSNEWIRQQLGLAQRPPAPTRVAEIEEKAPPRAKPVQRTARRPRKATQVRKPAATAAPQTAAPRTAAARTATQRTAAQRTAAQMTAASRIAERINPKLPEPKPGTDLVHLPTAPDFLQSRDVGMQSYDLEDPFVFTLSLSEAAAFRVKMANQAGLLRDPSQRVFRLGYLQDIAGEGDIATSREAAGTRKGVAEDIQAKLPNYISPAHKMVHPQDVAGDEQQTQLYLNRRREEMAEVRTIDSSGFPTTRVDQDELEWVHALPVYQPHGKPQTKPTEWAVVHFLPGTDQAPDSRDIPTVDEYVIAYGAQGTQDETRYGQDIQLDPNAAYEVIAPPGSRPGARISPQMMWDPVNEVVVNRWFIAPISEAEVTDLLGDVEKAERPAHRQFHEYDVVRDYLGRFAEIPDEAPTQQPAPPAPGHLPSRRRTARKPRRAKTIRRAQPEGRIEAQLETDRRVAAARTAAQRTARQRTLTPRQASIARAVNRAATQRIVDTVPEHEAEHLPILDDRHNYHVLSGKQWDELQKTLPKTKLDDMRGGFSVTPAAWHYLAHLDQLDGSGVVGELNLNVEDEITRAEGPAQTAFEWNRRPAGRGQLQSPDDDFKMGRHIDDLFARFPDIAQIHIDYVTHPGEYVLYANRKPVSPQVLIERDPDLDYTKPMALVPLGTYRSTEILRRRDDLEGRPLMGIMGDDPNPVNATMEQFRLQNAKVRRFRLENDDDGPQWG